MVVTLHLRKRILSFIILMWAFNSFGQTTSVSGRITDANSGEEISFASVFLGNSSTGSQSNSAGYYNLKNIKPGKYDLIVKFIGYQTFTQDISCDVKDQEINIRLIRDSLKLAEIVIRPDPDQARNYAIFKREFIGTSAIALSSKILNPDVVRVSYEPGRLLEASSDDFLIIENKHLGYRIKYLLNEFTRTFIPGEFNAGMLYFEGVAYFEKMKGTKSKVKQWKKNRLDTYRGSSMHFYRSLVRNNYRQEGFSIYRLIKKDNQDRPADSIINSKINRFRQDLTLAGKDSTAFWHAKKRLPKQFDYLLKDTLPVKEIMLKTDQNDIFALHFQDNLYITYKGKLVENHNSDVYRPLDMGDVAVTILTLKEKYALFDTNGIIVNPKSIAVEGFWYSKISSMLPHDYDPEEN
ncbi:MAG TPA: carboxypeptidase-like regulatory domain-containing protein [Sphingobacteriaceae bacterium]|nr:carboxypeptidase-like regulatory domain-containing protein [Sphingobacteriaceae bacterium]